MSDTNINYAVGIDLGTTNSCIAIYRNNKIEIIANEFGHRTTPSYISFTKNQDIIVGDQAKREADQNPDNTIFEIKRLMGKKYYDSSVQQDLEYLPYTIEKSSKQDPMIKIIHEQPAYYSPEEISALILKKMKEIGETYLSQKIKNVVITVPAYFNDSQRQATQDAALLADLNTLRIINEPTAAAIAYGLHKKEELTILVYDLGGGTLDTSLLTIDNGMFLVKATAGDTHLGGSNFDNKLIDWSLTQFIRRHPHFALTTLKTNKKVLRKLKTACEQAKKTLSTTNSTTINITALYDGIDLQLSITKSKFENLCEDEFKRCLKPIKQVLKDARISRKNIDEIILVGGATKLPKIRSMISTFFNNKELRTDINPDETVAHGAAIQAAILSETPSEYLRSLILVDVNPLSLGIETNGGLMSKLIERNTTIPCTKEKTFSTYSDNQRSVIIKIYEGERELVKHNHFLGEFELTDIPPMLRSIPKIKVQFHINANGILDITATEESTNHTKNITINNKNKKYTEEDIQRLINNAEHNNTNDTLSKDLILAHNELELYLTNVKQLLDNNEYRNKLGDKNTAHINNLIIDTTQWLQGNINITKPSDYLDKKQELINQVTPLFSAMYSAS